MLQKPFLWIFLFVDAIIGISILIVKSYSPNSPKNLPSRVSEKPKPGSCLVLEQRYCSQGKLVDWKDPNGTTYKFIVFNLPNGTPVLAPFKGDFYPNPTGEGNPLKVPTSSLADPSGNYKGTFIVMGDINFNNQQQHPVSKGDTIGYVRNNGINIFDGNLALTFTSSQGSDEQMLNKLLGK